MASFPDFIFTGFGIYSILFAISYPKLKETFIREVDHLACSLYAIMGIVFVLIFLFQVEMEPVTTEDGRHIMVHKGFWARDFWFWLEFGFLVLLTQIFWIKKFRKWRIIRFMVGMLLLYSIERISILISSFHRDFLPSSFETPLSDLLFDWGFSFWAFMMFVGGFYAVRLFYKK